MGKDSDGRTGAGMGCDQAKRMRSSLRSPVGKVVWFIVHAYPVLRQHTADRFASLGLSAIQLVPTLDLK